MIYSVGFAGILVVKFPGTGWVLQRDSVGFFGLFKGVSPRFLWLVLELFFCFKRYCENFSWCS